MADGIPPRDAGTEETSPPQPPPLDSIRVKGPGAKGLNKPAILVTAGGGVALVLALASGAFSSDPERKPAETRPMMSDPARPEMAKSAIRDLPATYSEAAARQPAPAPIPRLGPPLAGDMAAFAPAGPHLRRYVPGDLPPENNDWSPDGPSYAHPTAADPELDAERDAERAGLFFALRDAPRAVESPAPQQAVQSPASPLTVVSPVTADPAAPSEGGDRILFPGAVISASLITDLNSESPGPVIAQVTQTVHDSATGRVPLIPQGARLIGDYRSSTRYGQSRVAIVWSRLILPDGVEVHLDAPASDPSGAAGVSGEVDNDWGDVFGAAALGTLINIGVATTEEPQLTYGGLGVKTRDPVDAAVADGVQRSATTVTNRVVDRGLSTPPTIRVQAGTRISVIVTRRSVF
jgi:type IV secretory pathway VirB10-like protein